MKTSVKVCVCEREFVRKNERNSVKVMVRERACDRVKKIKRE